jgi:predicted MFS family arabinose efflux permease
MTALRITSGFAASLIGVALGRMLAEHIGLGAIPWPASIAGAAGVTAVSTVRLLRHKRRRDTSSGKRLDDRA